jgi:electron transport complex protein RnfB
MSAGKSASVEALADAIDGILPQTQCTRCGFPACRPYAQAIAAGEADINQCPPGGQRGIIRIARLVGGTPKPLNPANGTEGPVKLAFIDEAACIGCTLCIQACPVDAIVGAAKLMHTVVADLCTGCELCVAPCPVDCIAMIDAPDSLARWTDERADDARQRYEFRKIRLAREEAQRNAKPRISDAAGSANGSGARQALIRAAMERARAMQASTKPKNTENLPEAVEQRLREIDARRGNAGSADPAEKT